MRQGKLPKIFVLSLTVTFLLAIILSGSYHQQTAASAAQALLSKLPYPATVLGAQEEASVYVRIEGQDETIWRGSVTVSESAIIADNSNKTYHLSDPTVLGALDEASQTGDFPYYVTDTYGALFVSSIGEEENKGTGTRACGWQYRVNYYCPSVAAGRFILGETTPPEPPHQEVLWYYGSGGDAPLKISFSDTRIGAGEEFTARVALYDDGSHDWSPCADATVRINHHNYTTGADGTADISIANEGSYAVFAEKDGCIRSDKIAVTVVASEPRHRSLTVDISPESGGAVDLSPNQPAESYSEDSEVELNAIPANGYAFGSWSGSLSGSINPTTVIMSRNKKVTANFVLFDTGNLTNMGLVKAGTEVTSISVDSCPAENLGDVPPDLDIQSAYVVDSEGSGSFTLKFTDVSNAEHVKFYKIVDASWTELENVTTSGSTAELDMEIGNSIIALMLPASEKPASFSASNLNISPEQVQPNQQVNISIDIANNGGKTGSYEAVLYINNRIEDSQTVSISPGSTQTVVFGITRATPDTYAVSMAEGQGQFTVAGSQASSGGLDTVSKIAIVVIIALVAGLAFLFRKIRQKA